jgi:hypothetical protein
VLTAAQSGLGLTVVTGSVTSTPGATVRVEFFANAAGDPEGRTLLGSQSVPTDGAGHGSFTAILSAALPAGQNLVTATVTDPNGDTSEFSAGVTATPIPPASLSGVVWEDFNNDGQVDFGENGIGGVTVTLAGTDFLGRPVNQSGPTDGDGAYVFLNLLPGTYTLAETQPAGYTQGLDAVGTAGGSLAATDQFSVALGLGVNGLNYNFGERPAAGGAVQHGQAAGIGFWNNRNGQALIKAFDAQVLATALSVYATNATLDSTSVAAQYGFTVGGDGLGAAAVSVGSDGDAFGVATNTTMTVMDLLLATDAQAVNGVLYNGNATRRSHANDVYTAINQAGGL